MKYFERVVLALLLLTWCGCSTSKTAEHELHIAQHQDLAADESLHVDTTTRQGPETITTTVEEFAIADPRAAGTEPGEGAFEPNKPDDPRGTNGTAGQSSQSRIVRRTVTVDKRGPVTETTHVDVDAGVTVRTSATLDGHDKSDKEMKPAAGCMLGLGFWGAIVLAALLAGAILYLKLRP